MRNAHSRQTRCAASGRLAFRVAWTTGSGKESHLASVRSSNRLAARRRDFLRQSLQSSSRVVVRWRGQGRGIGFPVGGSSPVLGGRSGRSRGGAGGVRLQLSHALVSVHRFQTRIRRRELCGRGLRGHGEKLGGKAGHFPNYVSSPDSVLGGQASFRVGAPIAPPLGARRVLHRQFAEVRGGGRGGVAPESRLNEYAGPARRGATRSRKRSRPGETRTPERARFRSPSAGPRSSRKMPSSARRCPFSGRRRWG